MNNLSEQVFTPKLIVIMGVSGTGKSTVATTLADSLRMKYLDGDDFHSAQAKAIMASGKQISAQMRQKWVDNICRHLTDAFNHKEQIVLAFSGLVACQRNQLKALPFQSQFILLTGEAMLIADRINQRQHHFVSSDFLQGQIDSFEPLTSQEKHTLVLDINQPLTSLITTIEQKLQWFLTI